MKQVFEFIGGAIIMLVLICIYAFAQGFFSYWQGYGLASGARSAIINQK
jgi:hypothetical protein